MTLLICGGTDMFEYLHLGVLFSVCKEQAQLSDDQIWLDITVQIGTQTFLVAYALLNSTLIPLFCTEMCSQQ